LRSPARACAASVACVPTSRISWPIRADENSHSNWLRFWGAGQDDQRPIDVVPASAVAVLGQVRQQPRHVLTELTKTRQVQNLRPVPVVRVTHHGLLSCLGRSADRPARPTVKTGRPLDAGPRARGRSVLPPPPEGGSGTGKAEPIRNGMTASGAPPESRKRNAWRDVSGAAARHDPQDQPAQRTAISEPNGERRTTARRKSRAVDDQ